LEIGITIFWHENQILHYTKKNMSACPLIINNWYDQINDFQKQIST